MKTLKIKITLIEGMLGTSPNDEDIYRNYIGSKSPDAATIDEEVEALGVDAVAEKGMTVFPKLADGTPFLYDYMIKGFFKGACGALNRLTGKDPATGKKLKAVNESGKLTAYKKIIDTLIFVGPRQIPIDMHGGAVDICQRPLRAQTAQGERVALAMSEEVPEGSEMVCEITCLDDNHIAAVKEWLDYGKWSGLGQWRNSGKGRFTWQMISES